MGSLADRLTGKVALISGGASGIGAAHGVRANSIHPGQIDTPILGQLTPEQDAAIRAAIPTGKRGRPEDIAYGSLYLCSDEAAYVTGIELPIDAGWSAG